MKKLLSILKITAFRFKSVGKKILWANGGQISNRQPSNPHKTKVFDWKSVTKPDTAAALRDF